MLIIAGIAIVISIQGKINCVLNVRNIIFVQNVGSVTVTEIGWGSEYD